MLFTLNYEKENIKPFVYELPDGNNIIIKDPEIRCLKKYFNPDIYQFTKYGFDFYCSGEICVDLIQKCDYDIRKDLYNSIVLSGGNFMFSGLKETIEEDAKTLVYESMKKEIKVIASPERKFVAWLGGSILFSSLTFANMFIYKSEYEESGATIVHRKCFC